MIKSRKVGLKAEKETKKMRTSHGDDKAKLNQSGINIQRLLKDFLMKHGFLRSGFESRKTGSRPVLKSRAQFTE